MIIDYQHLPGVAWFLGGLVVMLVVGWGVVRIWPRRERIDSLLVMLAPASLYVLLAVSLLVALHAPQEDWSAGRFSPTYSLLRGYTLYYPADSGPIYNTIYPPMSYLAYLPAAFCDSPTAALFAAALIGQVLVLGPILALLSAPHGVRGSTRSPLVSAFVFFGFWKFLWTPPLSGLMGQIHSDTPAFGFAALALAVLYIRRLEATPSIRTMLSSAIFASMAVWSKQIFASLFLILPLWMLLTHGIQAALKFAGWLGATVAAFTAIFVAAFGLKPMLFNIIELPKSHPWMFAPKYRHGFAVFLTEMGSFSLPVILGLFALVYLSRGRAAGTEEDPLPASRLEAARSFFRGNYWLLFAAMGVVMIPLGLLARIKQGGAFNSYSPTIYFLAIAPGLLLLDWYAENIERGREYLNVAIKAMVLVWPMAPLLMVNSSLLSQYWTSRPLYQNSQEVAYQYALKHPGEAYFPWNTLSTLMAEGQAYHFEPGMADRDLGGVAPSETHFRRHLPDKLRVVAYPPDRIMEWTMKYFPEFKRRVVIDELPGWICYER
jgi:hypothetical protein